MGRLGEKVRSFVPWSQVPRARVLVKWPSRIQFWRSDVGVAWQRVLQPESTEKVYTYELTIWNESLAQPLNVGIGHAEPSDDFLVIPLAVAGGDFHSRRFTVGANGLTVWLQSGAAGQPFAMTLADYGGPLEGSTK